jgi:hypothetical protein
VTPFRVRRASQREKRSCLPGHTDAPAVDEMDEGRSSSPLAGVLLLCLRQRAGQPRGVVWPCPPRPLRTGAG